MSFNAEDLFGDFSDNDGFSDDENISSKGKQICSQLSTTTTNTKNFTSKPKTHKDNWKAKNPNITDLNKNDSAVRDIYSGIRLTNPLISSDELRILMQGRKMIKLSTLKSHINKSTNDVDDDWVTIGIVVNKMSKVSKNGNEYSLWKLSDLKSDKVVSFLLFGNVHEKHWKMPVGSVIGLLNASILSDSKGSKEFKKNSTEICSLTIDDHDKLLHIGTSKDMGYCKAVKKNGDVCGNLIAKSEDEYCLYHIKNAYRKFSSKRAEIQSSFSNKEPEDFHFANNFTPNVTLNANNIVLEMKTVDKKQLVNKKQTEAKNLQKVLANPLSKAAQNLAVFSSKSKVAVCKDNNQPSESPISAKDIFSKLNSNKSSTTPTSNKDLPTLAKGYKRGQMIDFKINSCDMQMDFAKKRAIEIFKNKPAAVPVRSSNNQSNILINSNKSNKLKNILQKVNQSLNESNEELKKEQMEAEKEKSRLIEEALNRKSINAKVVNVIESEAQDKYFKTLEKKERYENRLAEIKELTTKVVTCKICKYTSFGQSDLCKSQNHDVVHHQAKKRFFMCKNCKTRSFTFDSKLPSKPCKQCGSLSFEKASMINVKTETKLGEKLLIRGEEITFLNSVK